MIFYVWCFNFRMGAKVTEESTKNNGCAELKAATVNLRKEIYGLKASCSTGESSSAHWSSIAEALKKMRRICEGRADAADQKDEAAKGQDSDVSSLGNVWQIVKQLHIEVGGLGTILPGDFPNSKYGGHIMKQIVACGVKAFTIQVKLQETLGDFDSLHLWLLNAAKTSANNHVASTQHGKIARTTGIIPWLKVLGIVRKTSSGDGDSVVGRYGHR
jgi:hypothetical protein